VTSEGSSSGFGAKLAHLRAEASYRWGLTKLAWSRRLHPGRRLMASICGNFPIYSQTFVYQELVQLQAYGFEVRHAYSFSLPRSDLHKAFSSLWSRKVLLDHDYERHQRDFDYYKERFPERVQALISEVAKESGMSEGDVTHHHDFLRGFTFTRMVEAWRPTWLHSYFFYERSLYSLIAGWILELPRGISSYADHLLEDYELKLVPLQLRLCDVVVATSARIKEELLSLAPEIDPDKVVVKPNAIDSQHFPVVKRSAPGAGEPFRMACVARIEPKKGLLHLAEAVQVLTERGRNVEVHLIGEADPSDEEGQACHREMQQFCEQHGITGRVHFEGRRSQSEVLDFLKRSHAFVAPFVETDTGDKDGIPTALLEALATGIPTIVTDAGSMLEVVTDGVDGLVVGQRDGEAIAAAIESLIEDDALCQRIGAAAAETVKAKFDVRVCESRLHKLIEKVLAAKPGRG